MSALSRATELGRCRGVLHDGWAVWIVGAAREHCLCGVPLFTGGPAAPGDQMPAYRDPGGGISIYFLLSSEV